MSTAHRTEAGHVIPAAVSPPHDQRAHGLPQDLHGSEEESADPPVATGTEPAKQARQKPLEEDVPTRSSPPRRSGWEDSPHPSVVTKTRWVEPSTDLWCSVPVANLSDHPPDTLVCQHTDERVGHRKPGRPDQTPLERHHVANDQHDRPPDRSANKREPPPPPEDQAEQDQCRDHSDSFPRPSDHLSPPPAGNIGRPPSWRGRHLAQASRANPNSSD
jgi:hypothetical protein